MRRRVSIHPRSFLSTAMTYRRIRKFVFAQRSGFLPPVIARCRYHENRCITKMKPFDPIGRIDDSSAFSPRHTLFPFPFHSAPRREQIVPIATAFPFLSLSPRPLFPLQRDKLFFLCRSLEKRAGSTAEVSVVAGNGRRAAVVDPGVSHVL